MAETLDPLHYPKV